jgi:hypothetical protein
VNWEKRADYGLFSVAGETLYGSSGFFLVAVARGSVHSQSWQPRFWALFDGPWHRSLWRRESCVAKTFTESESSLS